jgi:phenylalanine-4-hydroxylase
MKNQERVLPLGDHTDARMVTAEPPRAAADRRAVVELDPDHPGFRDAEYRARRNRIARLALDHSPGEPIPEAPYTPEEHAVWRTIREALEPRHRQFACAEFLESLGRLDLPRERIPQLGEVSAKIEALSGFRLEPVAGLVEPRVFLETLAGGVFLCTQYIRHHSTPLYTPEPDVVHEVIGHANMLANPAFADLYEEAGKASVRAETEAGLGFFSKVFWFTLEFGVLWEGGELRAYGAGLLSSFGEIEAFRSAEVRPWDLPAMGTLGYDITRYQPVLFAAASFERMVDDLTAFFAGFDDDTPARLGAA